MVSSVGSSSFNSMMQAYARQEDYEEAVSELPQGKLVVDADAGSAVIIGPDGQAMPVSKQQMEKILADNGLQFNSKTKGFSDIDGYNLSVGEANASSLGGIPELPTVGSANTQISASGINAVQSAFNRFGDQGLEANALMLLGLLAVLHSAQGDRNTNMRMVNTSHNMKNNNHKMEQMAKENLINSRIAQAEKAVKDAWVTGIISVCCAVIGCVGGALGDAAKGASGATANILKTASKFVTAGGNFADAASKAIYQLASISTQQSNTESRQKAEVQEKQAAIEAEIIEQMAEILRDSASDNKDEMKQIMKLLQDVAQRQSDSVRAMNV